MYKAKVLAIGLILTLAACSEGPSKSEAEGALSTLVNSVATMLGMKQNSGDIQVHVSDLKCTKAGEDIYNCAVLIKSNGQDVQDNYRFTKLGGQWRAEHIN